VGADCIHFGIPAQTASNGWWCGVILLQAPGFTASNGNPGVDITAGHYTKCVFQARVGGAPSPVQFTAGNPAVNGANSITPTLGNAWLTYTINMTDTTNFTQIRQFFVIGLASGIGSPSPVDVYVDDLRYQQ
jgi:hypothetical protein